MPADLPYYGFAESDFAGRRCLVARLGYSGEAGYEIVVAADDAPALWEALRTAGAADGLEECGFTAIDTLRIEAGHILFSNELALEVTPYELGLARLVDHYRKPSTGMTALAARRFHEPQRRLVGLLLDGPASPVAGDSTAIPVSSARHERLPFTAARSLDRTRLRSGCAALSGHARAGRREDARDRRAPAFLRSGKAASAIVSQASATFDGAVVFAARSADAIVLQTSIVTVIGPTPPGTGVM